MQHLMRVCIVSLDKNKFLEQIHNQYCIQGKHVLPPQMLKFNLFFSAVTLKIRSRPTNGHHTPMSFLCKFGYNLPNSSLVILHTRKCHTKADRICTKSNMHPSPSVGEHIYSKTCVKRPPLKKNKIGLKDQLLLNEGHKYCRMLHLELNAGQKNCRKLQVEHSAILSTFIKLPILIKIFVLSIFERPFYTCIFLYSD